MGDRAQKEAWVTLATNDAYALGCLVLGNSLRRVQTTRQLVVMICEGVSQGMRCGKRVPDSVEGRFKVVEGEGFELPSTMLHPGQSQLENVFDSLVEVDVLDSEDARNLSLLGRPDLNVTYTKIHCWQLTQYEKCVFLDADTLVIQHCDELFDREELSAAPDAGWPDCFNSGVFVFRPSLETYQSILNFAASKGSFDGGDQGLLNSYFNTWPTEDIMKHLPFIYNVVSQAFYSYLPAFTQFRSSIKIVHFIGAIKPWNHPYNTASRTVTVFPETGHCQEFLQMWWDLFMEMVQPRLDPTVWVSIARPYILVNLSTGGSSRVVWLFLHAGEASRGVHSHLIKKATALSQKMEELMKEEAEKENRHTPFIRYEYVLPSSPPPVPSPQGCEAAHPQEDHPTSYQVLYPYVPPALDHTCYTPPHPQPGWAEAPPPPHSPPPCHYSSPACPRDEDSSPPSCETWAGENNAAGSGGGGEAESPQVVDMPIVVRSFHPYETHYVEESLLLIDPDSPPPALYDSSHFEQMLADEAENLKPEEAPGDLVISVGGDAGEGWVGAVTADVAAAGVSGASSDHGGGDPGASQADRVPEVSSGAKDVEGAVEEGRGGQTQSVDSSHVRAKGSTGGLVGELAQMKVGGGGDTADYMVLDDRERRLAWERGHADYLGVDSFANIMKKLDEKMAPVPAGKEDAKKSEGTQSETALASKPAE